MGKPNQSPETRKENGYTVAEAVVGRRWGLYTRPSVYIFLECKKYSGEIYLTKHPAEEKPMTRDAKSILQLLSLAAIQGTPIKIQVSGEDHEAKRIASGLCEFINSESDEVDLLKNKTNPRPFPDYNLP